MFNSGKFNLKRFNLPGRSDDIIIRETMTATVGSLVDVGQNVHLQFKSAETVNGAASMGCIVAEQAEAEATFGAKCAAVANYYTSEALTATFGESVSLFLKCYISGKFAGTFGAILDIGEDIYLNTKLSDGVQFSGVLGALFAADPIDAYEIVNCLVSTAVFDTLYVTLDVTIPPGGKLILDSENFLALLNDENVLDKHSGDWVELSRSVEQIIIDGGGTSALNATMLYTERYL